MHGSILTLPGYSEKLRGKEREPDFTQGQAVHDPSQTVAGAEFRDTFAGPAIEFATGKDLTGPAGHEGVPVIGEPGNLLQKGTWRGLHHAIAGSRSGGLIFPGTAFTIDL